MDSEKEFEVTSKLGKTISTTKEYWKIITEIKHTNVKDKQKSVMKTLVNPVIIKRSVKDKNVCLYYGEISGKLLCAVTKHENGTGFLVTAYFTDRVKKGEIIWQKQQNPVSN